MDITYLNKSISKSDPEDHIAEDFENELIKKDQYLRKVRLAVLGSVYLVLIIFSLLLV